MKLEGTVENIIYTNKSNGWTVLLIKNGKAVFTLVGSLVKIDIGDNIEAEVEEYMHKDFGLQYKILKYNVYIPSQDENAIYKFLVSLSVKGVGEATVKRIIDNFGKDAIDIITTAPEKLFAIKGMTEARINSLKEKIMERSSEIDIIIELEKYELGTTTIKRVLEKYGAETLNIIKENPYKLAIEIDGIGFNVCDKIASLNGYEKDSVKRAMAGIMYIVETEYWQGNVYSYKNDVINKVIELLQISSDYNFDDAFYNLEIDLKIKTDAYDDKELIFLKSAYNIEKKLSEILYSKKDYITIVTGGPGTGKTYNIKKYLTEAENRGIKVALAAPTGRAAKRINEVTGYEAKTIHRLLECTGDISGKSVYFARNEENKLDIDMLIVDEMSMVDESLMYNLVRAVPEYTEIILVGDVNQLPSVGAGQVLKDMIDSNYFNVKKLTKIHRQNEGSKIVISAHSVNEGKEVAFEKDDEEFIFTHMTTEGKIKETIKKLVKENVPNHFHISIDEIQVICPSKKGICGTESLNVALQEVLNEESFDKDEIVVGDTIFRIGDKVMQTSNNYNIPYDVKNSSGMIVDKGVGVFNGDIGRIVDIDVDERNVIVKYDDREAYYISKDLVDLSLAYAITVHKSQGSEYDVVIMPMARAPYQLLNRKILYTAITRAKKCIIFVGTENYFNEMLNNKYETVRNSALLSKLYLYDI
ncbi:MAG: AAA family ATPase [Lachnospiraceae bacterium]|nr:AAA family ATPase [Lachnospiraceae bacterium]